MNLFQHKFRILNSIESILIYAYWPNYYPINH